MNRQLSSLMSITTTPEKKMHPLSKKRHILSHIWRNDTSSRQWTWNWGWKFLSFSFSFLDSICYLLSPPCCPQLENVCFNLVKESVGVGAMCVLKAASMLSRADAPRFRVVHRVAAAATAMLEPEDYKLQWIWTLNSSPFLHIWSSPNLFIC